jgi:hypothetical protein
MASPGAAFQRASEFDSVLLPSAVDIYFIMIYDLIKSHINDVPSS